jgi:hypothetical protein
MNEFEEEERFKQGLKEHRQELVELSLLGDLAKQLDGAEDEQRDLEIRFEGLILSYKPYLKDL